MRVPLWQVCPLVVFVDGSNCVIDPGVPVHANKRRDVSESVVEKIDEELANMRSSKDANVQV